MNRQLLRIAPLRAGVVLAVLYAFFGLLMVPIIMLMSAAVRLPNPPPQNLPQNFPPNFNPLAIFGGCAALFFPIAYGVMGFISGVIGAALYNVVAKLTGGLEFLVVEAPATPQPFGTM
jgi:hypothetical protein